MAPTAPQNEIKAVNTRFNIRAILMFTAFVSFCVVAACGHQLDAQPQSL